MPAFMEVFISDSALKLPKVKTIIIKHDSKKQSLRKNLELLMHAISKRAADRVLMINLAMQ